MRKLLLVAVGVVAVFTFGLGFGVGCAAPAYVAGKRTPLPVSPDVRHAEARLPVKDGIELFHQSWRTDGDARGVVVLVHGLKDHGSRYSELAERLARKGFAVHAMDLRGHGDSSGDRVWIDAWDQYLGDLDAFVKKVRAQEGARPLFVFGHSMGGAIVTTWTLDRKPEVAGLILSGPALKPGSNVNGALIAVTGFLGSALPTLAVLELDDTQFSRDPKVVEAMKTDPLVYDGNGPARTAKELLGALERIGTKMEELERPFLIVHGAADTVTNPDGSKELHARAKAQDKTLKLYDGLYHDLLHEPEREQVMADIEAWLEARAPAAPTAAPAAGTGPAPSAPTSAETP